MFPMLCAHVSALMRAGVGARARRRRGWVRCSPPRTRHSQTRKHNQTRTRTRARIHVSHPAACSSPLAAFGLTWKSASSGWNIASDTLSLKLVRGCKGADGRTDGQMCHARGGRGRDGETSHRRAAMDVIRRATAVTRQAGRSAQAPGAHLQDRNGRLLEGSRCSGSKSQSTVSIKPGTDSRFSLVFFLHCAQLTEGAQRVCQTRRRHHTPAVPRVVRVCRQGAPARHRGAVGPRGNPGRASVPGGARLPADLLLERLLLGCAAAGDVAHPPSARSPRAPPRPRPVCSPVEPVPNLDWLNQSQIWTGLQGNFPMRPRRAAWASASRFRSVLAALVARRAPRPCLVSVGTTP